MTRIHHMCIDVRGALRWGNKLLKKLFVDKETGKYLTPQEAKEHLLDLLSEGKRVIPFGEPCEGFDYVNGCPGHSKTSNT